MEDPSRYFFSKINKKCEFVIARSLEALSVAGIYLSQIPMELRLGFLRQINFMLEKQKLRYLSHQPQADLWCRGRVMVYESH